MKKILEEAQNLGKIEDNKKFNWEFWYFIGVDMFGFSDKDFWSLTMRKLISLANQKEKMNERANKKK